MRRIWSAGLHPPDHIHRLQSIGSGKADPLKRTGARPGHPARTSGSACPSWLSVRDESPRERLPSRRQLSGAVASGGAARGLLREKPMDGPALCAMRPLGHGPPPHTGETVCRFGRTETLFLPAKGRRRGPCLGTGKRGGDHLYKSLPLPVHRADGRLFSLKSGGLVVKEGTRRLRGRLPDRGIPGPQTKTASDEKFSGVSGPQRSSFRSSYSQELSGVLPQPSCPAQVARS